MPATSESSSTFKDVSIIMATSGVTTLNVRLHPFLPVPCPQVHAHFAYVPLIWQPALHLRTTTDRTMPWPPEQVFLNGALTVALPTIGKDLRFKEVRVCA